MKVAIYGVSPEGVKGSSKDRPDCLGNALAAGFRKHNVEHSLHHEFNGVIADVALAYGWSNELKFKVFSQYRDAGKHFVFFDLGYWDRGRKGAYKVAVDDWDSATNMLRNMPDDRLQKSGITLRDDWDPNSDYVMIVGMSEKGAGTHGYKFNEWEKSAQAFLMDKFKGSNLRFEIRQKPRGGEKDKSPGIQEVLKSARFVVSHHSNVSVECLITGIPYTCKKGAGIYLSTVRDPDRYIEDAPILNPTRPSLSERKQLLSDVAYVQWTIKEMAEGHCWDYIKRVLCA